MKPRWAVLTVAVIATMVVAVTVRREALVAGDPRDIDVGGEPMVAFSERANRDVQIRVWHQALDADSMSAIALGQLAALHLQRAREGGTWSDYLEAEQFARRSLALRTNRNTGTAATLANILLAQHRFSEAQYVAAQLLHRDPDVPQYRALLGEISMELGDDATAKQMFDSLWAQRTHLPIASRLARWAELTGHTDNAYRILTAARAQARSRTDVPKETKAWYELRVGELEQRIGHPRNARIAFEAGLRIEPNDPRLLAAMGRLEAAVGEPAKAISWGDRAIAIQLDPDLLGLVGDAYTQLGDTARSAEYYRAMEAAVSGIAGPFHRAWSVRFLDRGIHVRDVLDRAREEYANRKDVYGCDLLAWALHKSGRDDEAQPVMRQALRFGTPDANLWFHDGMIALALGQRAHADSSLSRALTINAQFHPSAPAVARHALDSLRAGR